MSAVKTNLINREISFHGRFNDKLKEYFYSELGSLLESGVDIQRSLNILIEEQNNKNVYQTLSLIKDGLKKGGTLADLCKKSNSFSSYEYQSIRIGEETGHLQSVLFNLAEYFNHKTQLRKQMISVFTYPLFVLIIAISVLYFMMYSVVPMFDSVFQQFGKELPELTKQVMSISVLVSSYGLYLIVGVTALITFFFFQRKEEWFRKTSSLIVLKIPIFGNLIQKVYLARMSQGLSLLLGSKTPLVVSLDMIQNMIGFYPIEKALNQIKKEVKTGRQLNDSMSNFNIFDARMVSLTKIAEEINQLDVTYKRLAYQYQRDVEHRTKLIGTIMEPLMILLIGIIVGVIMIAMYLPMFNLTNVIQ